MVIDGFINFSNVIETGMGRFTFSINLLVDNRRIKAYSFPLGNNRSKKIEQSLEFNYIKRRLV